MLVDALAKQLLSAPGMRPFMRAFEAGDDATLTVSQSARALVAASLFSENPRSMLYIVSGEASAQAIARTLGVFVGTKQVLRYPALKAHPWSKAEQDAREVGERARALWALSRSESRIVVASAGSLLKQIPGVALYEPYTVSLGAHIAPEDVVRELLSRGYSAPGELDGPGTLVLRGDTLDVYPSHVDHGMRITFFGDEVDGIKVLLGQSAQSIGEVETTTLYAAREYALTQDERACVKRALWESAQTNSQVASDMEAMLEGVASSRSELYVDAMYTGLVSPLSAVSKDALVVMDEPRALIDDATRAHDLLAESAQRAAGKVQGVEKEVILHAYEAQFARAATLDFGDQQRVNFSALKLAGTRADATLTTKTPEVKGNVEKLMNELSGYCNQRFKVLFFVPHKSERETYELAMSDSHVPFSALETGGSPNVQPGYVTLVEKPLAKGMVVPEAKIAVFSGADVFSPRDAREQKAKIDVTKVTFPFKPGDYVVHAVHGVAKFARIVRQGKPGEEQDYFELDYASDDKLYVPLAQVGRITRYVGVNAEPPKLTRLKGGDWTRAVERARKNAKKLAFDLVDLYARRLSSSGFAYGPDTPEQTAMEEAFPYELTSCQARSIEEIKRDMEDSRPMDRLLSGDVGFGKTEVALRAAFKAVMTGKQVLVLCPTTILAQQHYETFKERFEPFGVSVDVLSRFRTQKQQKEALHALSAGSLDVLVGTHRLLSADVNPKDLGLVIIDEEQRFGVSAKEQLKNLRTQIDVLALSATPIPRTLQMSLSGVRDMSLLVTPPHGRLPVKVQVGEYDLDEVSAAIRTELARGGQVHYVSNRVASLDEAVARVKEAAPEARVGVAHGQMSAAEIERVMYDFQTQKTNVLIATTIIESGIDNPHTNTLIIEDAERLGLAQLYQLKGRVGRGDTQAFAYFFFSPGRALTRMAEERLSAIDEYQDLGAGIRVAMRDLEIRGAGSLIGAEQHGNVSKIGFDLFMELLQDAVEEAKGEKRADDGDVALSGPTINVGGQYFLDSEYIEAIDERVMVYRQIATASSLDAVSAVSETVEARYGEMPEAAQNLFKKQALVLLARELGVSSVTFAGGRLEIVGLGSEHDALDKVLSHYEVRAFPVSRKLSIKVSASEKPLDLALSVLRAVREGPSREGE